MDLGEKLKLMRKREMLTQAEMADLVGISLSTFKNYELGRRQGISVVELLKVTKHPRFMKYALWLVTDTTAPECGQVSAE